MDFPNLKARAYHRKLYRNIFTVSPSQHLFDDLCEVDDFAAVDALVQLTSEIDHDASQLERPFQYGVVPDDEMIAVFERHRWRWGRFGDGYNYGVWYGAEDPLTTLYEAAWWAYRLGKDNVLTHGEVYSVDRSMYVAQSHSSRSLDLSDDAEYLLRLVHPEDYGFCQALGKKLVEESFEILRTPSARRRGGVCTPVFHPRVLQNCEFLYYLRFHLGGDGRIAVSSSKTEMNFSLQAEDLRSPYGL